MLRAIITGLPGRILDSEHTPEMALDRCKYLTLAQECHKVPYSTFMPLLRELDWLMDVHQPTFNKVVTRERYIALASLSQHRGLEAR